MATERGSFVTFEGGEGAGKGTQLGLLRLALDARGISHVDVREPGGTVISEHVRELLLSPAHKNFSPRAELLLYGAARAQIVEEIIEPSLAAGLNVLCDRFYDSTTAYQGFGRDLPLEFIAAMKDFATADLDPNITIYLDIDPVIGLERATGEGADRLESEAIEFHQKVRQGFLWIASQEPNRFKVIDASGTPEEVHAEVLRILSPAFPGLMKGDKHETNR